MLSLLLVRRSVPAGTVFIALAAALSLTGCGGQDLDSRVRRVEDGPFGGSLAQRMAACKVPGVSIAAIDGNAIEWARGLGVADVASGDPVTPDTVFQASSISKAVTAVVALSLVEKGLVDLDQPVNRRLTSWQVPENEFTAQAPVTLRGLLGHTACINRPKGGFGYEGEYPSTVQVLDGERPATNLPAAVECVPGTEIRYSNLGYVIVQQLLEDVTGRPFPELARELVFEPLGMSSSTFEEPLSDSLARRAAAPHDSDGNPQPRSFNPHAVAQGGLWTTASDLARFLIEVMESRSGHSNKVLSPEMTRAMLTPHDPELSGGSVWALGFLAFGDWALLTGGADPGFRCLLAGFPGQSEGIAVMLNGEQAEPLQLRILLNFVAEYLVLPHTGRLVAGVFSVLILLSGLVAWPLGGLLRLMRRKAAALPDSEARRYGRTARLMGALVALLVLGLAYPFLVHAFAPQGPLAWSGGSPLVKALLAGSVLCCLLSLVLARFAFGVWKRRLWGPVGRVHFSLVSLGALCGSLLWLFVLGVV